MNHVFKPIFLALLFILPLYTYAQSATDSTYTPFRKGMWISGFTGTVSSTSFREKNSNATTNANTFDLKSNSALFIRDQIALGWSIIISGRGNSTNAGLGSSEIYLGPYGRYYFSTDAPGSMYADMTLFYSNIIDRDNAFTTVNTIQLSGQEIRLNGGGFRLGFGYTHILRKGIGFDFGMEFSALWAGGHFIDSTDNSRSFVNVYIGGIEFGFGFIIFINEFFY